MALSSSIKKSKRITSENRSGSFVGSEFAYEDLGSQELEKYSIKITSLAQGVPVGGELDYLDDSTIVAAFNARRKFE